MSQELLDWLLLLVRWLHITTAVTWIGSSIFFMWLDRSFEKNPNATRSGHIGDVWMVHGGGFYHVEKLQMGSVAVPDNLHWFKWESYWTWMSGIFLFSLIFFTGSGTFLLNPELKISFLQGTLISLFAIFASWFFYDALWESSLTKKLPVVGHILTILWIALTSYALCKTLSGRAAYIVVGAMIGTWMTANVFMRIIPRQLKMVEAAKRGESPNAEWAKNAKNRSTHNTYLTLPVIFIMLSNHFPNTYGHDLNWLILLLMCAAGAAIREYFVVRLAKPMRSKICAAAGALIILGVMILSRSPTGISVDHASTHEDAAMSEAPINPTQADLDQLQSSAGENFGPSGPAGANPVTLKGVIQFEGLLPERRRLTLPAGCAPAGTATFTNEVLVHNGKVENTLVRITRGHESLTSSPVPSEPVVLDQRHCIYEPRIAIARVNQEVVFLNSDPVFHNVRSLSEFNPNFNLAMPLKDQRIGRRFANPEISLKTNCSVHPWMGAYVAVSDHSFITLSDKAGLYEIPGLAPGRYEIEAWHEVFGSIKEVIDVPANQSQHELNLKFKYPQEKKQ